jgi:hypothetical protein
MGLPPIEGHGMRRAALALGLICLLVSAAVAQNVFVGDPGQGGIDISNADNTPYDGRFVFIRLSYTSRLGANSFRRARFAGWAHDYPRADVHFMKILDEITLLVPRMDGSNILSLDDPELFNFPVAYMSEPGEWLPSEKEVEGLSAYLRKGGFIIFDDFDGPDLYNLEMQMRKVVPEGRFVKLDGTHPIFHSFFEIDDPDAFIPPYGDVPPTFYGMYEDNDPAKRLIAVANYNNDIGEYWEFSDTGLVPIDLSNEAYKFGVNYIVYGMTH